MTFGDLFGGSDSEEDEGPVPSSGSRDRPPAEPKAKPKPKPTPSRPPEGARPTLFDPFRFPDGRPVPRGYNWDGVRLVRNKKGSTRPPDTPSELWYHYSQQQRENDTARWNRLVELHEGRVRRERRDAAPAMPVVREETEEQRERLTTLYWDQLDEVTHDQFALVARVVSQAEIDRTPEAKVAMDKEWQKLVDKSCWLEKKVREYRDVAREAKAKEAKAHFGRIFEICSQKGSELPKGHPEQKWKGRSVFQGNKVSDENNDHAIFAELGSSPASMEAAKIIDVYGSQPNFSKQQADARQAYTQALFQGVETWVRLPRNRWPKEWEGFEDPVCPLMLALYGHPDSGGIWENHCASQLEGNGWVQVLPEIWQSIFYHPDLELLLVIYVDDFKMAGFQGNLKKGWANISSVIDMDPPEAFGRYFGCHHSEQVQAKLPRSAHPFAYVFDKKDAPLAAAAARRSEDYWEVDPDLGAVVRHHVYPRKRLYVPTPEDAKDFPTMSSQRLTEFNTGQIIQDDINRHASAKQQDWWTGRTYFPIVESGTDELKLALAARKGRPQRSKAEAKREAKQSRFKGTDTICPEAKPSMNKPVNVMTYDMRDFLVSCVDRYCELAKVDPKSLKHVATPFHDNRVARPTEEGEPQGKLQPIASRVLMKILFAARMARWDLLRATQSLASRVTKWSRDCDVALHRLVCYINSSLDIRMQGFIGDTIAECQLWLFCDADWAGEHDSKSTSGCALYLVGPNTYYPLNAFSKKQTSITMSSTESEVISANHGVRAQGLPSLSLWSFLWKQVQAKPADRKVRPKPSPQRDQDIIARIDPELDDIRYGESNHPGKSVADIQGLNVALSDKFQVQFMEDNQATITIILKGDSEKMRHTDRTQRISFGWLKQQFERKLFNMINVGTKEQVADIFTKPFADKSKWDHAMKLINHIRVDIKLQSGGKDSDAHVVSKPHLTAIASIPTSRSIDQAEDLATRFVTEQDFSDTALNQMLTVLVQDSVKFYSFGLRPGQDYKHLAKATLKYPQTTIFFNKCIASRTSNCWTRLVVKTKALTPNDDASTEVYRTTTPGGTTVRLLSMNHDNLTSKEHQALLPLSFRTDDTHFAAPARTRPRPLDACNRVIVEFCCAEDSKLGEKRNASKGCDVIRVTETDDATKQSTIKRLCKDLRPRRGGIQNTVETIVSLGIAAVHGRMLLAAHQHPYQS